MTSPQFDQLRQTLALQVKVARKARKLNQEELADLAEVDRTYVSQIERAVNNPSLLVIFKLATALDVEVVELLRD